MSRLEDRYRRLLRLLPPWYRARREEEMVGTFMADRTDDLDLEYGWPGWGESWAVAVLALRSRLAAPGGPPRAVVLGDAVRLVALLGVVAAAAVAAAGLVRGWLWWAVAGMSMVGGWTRPLVVTAVTVGTAVALVLGRRASARLLAVAGLGYALFELVRRLGENGAAWPTALMDLPLLVTTVCLLAGFHGEAPAPGRGWLRALGGAVVVVVTWTALTVPPLFAGWTPDVEGSWMPPPMSGWERALLAADPLIVLPPLAVLVAAVVLVARPRADATWPSALTAATLALLPGQLVVVDSFATAGVTVEYAVALVPAVGLVAAGAVTTVLSVRGLRRLPRPTPGATA